MTGPFSSILVDGITPTADYTVRRENPPAFCRLDRRLIYLRTYLILGSLLWRIATWPLLTITGIFTSSLVMCPAPITTRLNGQHRHKHGPGLGARHRKAFQMQAIL